MQTDLGDIRRRALELAEKTIHSHLEEKESVSLAILHHLVVVWRDAQAIEALCQAGLSDTSLLPLRRSWEAILRLQFILLEPTTRAQAFLEESWVVDMRLLEAALSEPAEARGAIGAAVRSDSRLEARRHDLGQARASVSEQAQRRADQESRPRDLWSVHRMAQDLHRVEEYRFLYSFLCERTHGALNASKDLLAEGEKGELGLAIQDYSEMATGMVTAYLLYAAKELLHHTQSPDWEACQRLLDRLQASS